MDVSSPTNSPTRGPRATVTVALVALVDRALGSRERFRRLLVLVVVVALMLVITFHVPELLRTLTTSPAHS